MVVVVGGVHGCRLGGDGGGLVVVVVLVSLAVGATPTAAHDFLGVRSN